MTARWRDKILVHDTTSFDDIGIDIPGVETYSDRALLLPAKAAVVHDDPMLDGYLAWLRSPRVALGPELIIRVRGGRSLFAALDATPGAMDQVTGLLRKGNRFQVFNRTDEADAFFERHGIGPEQVHAPDSEIARRLGNKAEFRRMASEVGASEYFPEHYVTKDPSTVLLYVRKLLERPPEEVPFVVCKRTDLAGGYGVTIIRRSSRMEAEVNLFLREFRKNKVVVESRSQTSHETYSTQVIEEPQDIVRAIQLDFLDPIVEYVILRRPVLQSGLGRQRIRRGDDIEAAVANFRRSWCENEIIVEVGYPHEEKAFSSQFVVDRDDGASFLGITRQLIDGTHHVGNVVTRFPDTLLDLETQVSIKEGSMKYVNHLRRILGGFAGTVGFDFIVVSEGKRKGKVLLMECNPRQTASTYPLAVSRQLEGRVQEPPVDRANAAPRTNWAVKMRNAVPTSATSFVELCRKLGSRLFQDLSGIIPFNIRLLGLPEPHCGIMAVAPSVEEADAMMADAELRLITTHSSPA